MTDRYFNWLCNFIDKNRFHIEGVSYARLLNRLYSTEFIVVLDRDENRAVDGLDLRDRYRGKAPEGPCSVLEMMIALCLKCETLMDDARIGNRTSQWFWNMIQNLGLSGLYDSVYTDQDDYLVSEVLHTFIYREYDYDGRGGLFYIPNTPRDLRDVEIWFQLLWYLDNIA